MGDLMAQVELMRTGAYEAAERAAKAAVADTLATLPKPEPEPQIGLLRRDLDDLRSSRNGADERVQNTLESVHAALEKVVARLGSLDGEPTHAEPPARTPAERSPAPRIKAQAPTPRSGGSAPAPSPGEAPAVVLSEADQPILPASLEEILLEPGAARPRPGTTGANPDANLDVKASFIAAARRAAQAAAAEAAANAKVKGRGAREGSLASRVEGAKDGLAARMKGAVSKHRRPLLLGLAAIVLALGAFQTLGTLGLFGEAPPAKAPAVKSEARIAAPAPAPAPAIDPVEAAPSQLAEPAPKIEEPKTTQAISSPAAARSEAVAPASKAEERAAVATPGRFEPKAPVMSLPAGFTPLQITPAAPATTGAIDPRQAATPIANVAAVGEIPSPQGLGGLRQAALAGDPVAVYDLAARLAEGRGVTRDLKLAAKLFEKAAASGVVPAQYRIGNQYEKGLGVTRDLALARGWYERAAEKGNARAMHNLAVLLAEGGSDRKPDYAAAAEILPQGGRARRQGQPIQSRGAARPRPRRVAEPRPLLHLVRDRRRAGRRGRGPQARRGRGTALGRRSYRREGRGRRLQAGAADPRGERGRAAGERLAGAGGGATRKAAGERPPPGRRGKAGLGPLTSARRGARRDARRHAPMRSRSRRW